MNTSSEVDSKITNLEEQIVSLTSEEINGSTSIIGYLQPWNI